jgi:hypothetical protein
MRLANYSSMQSKVIALLGAEGSREATMLVRRRNGQFALSRIDGRVATAARLADRYPRRSGALEIALKR